MFHSVETALVRVNNDLLRAVDDHGEAVSVLLDMSAAFETVDHKNSAVSTTGQIWCHWYKKLMVCLS